MHWFYQVIHLLKLICAVHHQIINILLFLWSWTSYLNIKYANSKNKMDKNPDKQLIIMQATIESNRQDSDEKRKNLTEDLTEMIK